MIIEESDIIEAQEKVFDCVRKMGDFINNLNDGNIIVNRNAYFNTWFAVKEMDELKLKYKSQNIGIE